MEEISRETRNVCDYLSNVLKKSDEERFLKVNAFDGLAHTMADVDRIYPTVLRTYGEKSQRVRRVSAAYGFLYPKGRDPQRFNSQLDVVGVSLADNHRVRFYSLWDTGIGTPEHLGYFEMDIRQILEIQDVEAFDAVKELSPTGRSETVIVFDVRISNLMAWLDAQKGDIMDYTAHIALVTFMFPRTLWNDLVMTCHTEVPALQKYLLGELL